MLVNEVCAVEGQIEKGKDASGLTFLHCTVIACFLIGTCCLAAIYFTKICMVLQNS